MRRGQLRFLLVLCGSLCALFSLLSLRPVDAWLVEPFTAGVARVSGALLLAIGQDVRMAGTLIEGASFAVNIRNGCNGLEAMVIFIAAVIAFPASLTRRALGTILGILFIYSINLLRVVGLYLTGLYLPQFFNVAHTVVAQTVLIIFTIAAWLVWAQQPDQASLTRASLHSKEGSR